MPSPKTRMKPAAAIAAVSLFALAGAARGVVVCDSVPPIAVPVTTAGVYVNLVTGVSAVTPAGSPGWDFNPWGSSVARQWFNNAADPSSAGAVATGTVINVLSSGATVGPASTYSGETPTAADSVNWQTTHVGLYLGIRFWNEGTAAINYGWVQLDTVSATTGLPMTIQSWCYENDGTAITAGTTPVELETFTVD